MNYITLIRNFWQIDNQETFSDKEIALYFYLLNICNANRWLNPFKLSNNMLIAKLRWNKQSLRNAQNKLQKAQLINLETGLGRGNSCKYTLIAPPYAKKPYNEESKKWQNPTYNTTQYERWQTKQYNTTQQIGANLNNPRKTEIMQRAALACRS